MNLPAKTFSPIEWQPGMAYDGVLQCRRLIMREGQITRGSDGVLQGGCRTEWEEWKDVPDVMEERSDEH